MRQGTNPCCHAPGLFAQVRGRFALRARSYSWPIAAASVLDSIGDATTSGVPEMPQTTDVNLAAEPRSSS